MNRRILYLVLCFALLLSAVGITAHAEELPKVYYAEIQSITAVYDQYTEKIEFCITFDGAVLQNHSFTAIVSYKQNGSQQMFGIHTLSFAECLSSNNTLEGALTVGKESYFTTGYSDWQISVSGKKLNTSVTTAEYYSMDSGEAAVSLKAEPEGKLFDISSSITPAETPAGGYVDLSITVGNANSLLSGGLSNVGFTLEYDSDLLRLDRADYVAQAEGWTISNEAARGKVSFSFSGTQGLTKDRTLVLKIRFETLKGGTCGFALSHIFGGDSYGHSYSDETGYDLDASLTIKGGLLGDVDGNGTVDSADASIVLRYDVGLLDVCENGDVSKDGRTDNADASLILRYDVGLIEGF